MAETVRDESIADIETPPQTPGGVSLATNPLPADIGVSDARLPATYEKAKAALVQCSRIDECQEWANKAEALASYARQSEDETLFRYAKRIQGRAVRRAGELLKEINGKGNNQHGGGAPTKLTQSEAAERAGLSKDQQVTAVRVANLPADQFEQAVERDEPATVTALAEMGKQSRAASPAEPSPAPEPAPPPTAASLATAAVPPVTAPAGVKQATHLTGVVRDFATFCQKNDPVVVAGGLMKSEVHTIRSLVGVIDGWLDCLVVNLSSDAQS
jgi:hypothetical protein